jgi:hypothetical protein
MPAATPQTNCCADQNHPHKDAHEKHAFLVMMVVPMVAMLTVKMTMMAMT